VFAGEKLIFAGYDRTVAVRNVFFEIAPDDVTLDALFATNRWHKDSGCKGGRT
jgi:hypothetical protein